MKGQGTDDRYSSESHKTHTSHYYKYCGINCGCTICCLPCGLCNCRPIIGIRKYYLYIKAYTGVVLEFSCCSKTLIFPLHKAIAILHYMICYFLQYGDTPIHLASRNGHVKVVKKLISSGADVNVVNKVSVNY